jgi:SAM-dependent methyltransferase
MFGFRRDIFDRLSNEEAYLATMNNAQASTKMNILDYVQGDSVVDVGSGGGVLLDALEKRFPDKMIAGTDISQNVIEVLQKKIDTEDHSYEIWRHNFVDDALWSPVENIIFSSIIHEIFSYTEMDSKKFNIDSVQRALYHAKESLSSGGRIIIRDGVKTDSNDVVSVRIKDDDMMILAKNYLRDFQGLSELKDENGNWKNLKIDGNVISADINLIREMLYTITWGPMSYAAEVQEQFGYMTLTDYCVALESIGMHIIEAKQFTEPGYPEHLNDKVDLIDFTWDDIPSNCIIVAEKC